MDILDDLKWRGLVHQSTDEGALRSFLAGGVRSVYAGFDPTADSLHVGSLMPLLLLRRFQRAGHRPIAVAGGATGMIGDPSGKSAERNLLDHDRLAANLAGIESQLRMLLDFDAGPRSALVVNNHDWLGSISLIDFLRDVGKHAPVNVMLAKESIKTRLSSETGLSYTEFTYMLLQAFDFVHLMRTHDCRLQVGGADQWGNITAGIDLARRMYGEPLYGLVCPLLVKTDGGKMGKTERGAVWLDPRRTSPYQFYQYWLNVADDDAGMCLRFMTELSHDEIAALDQSRAAEPEARASQRTLADELTRLIHGADGLERARMASEILFGAEIQSMTDEELMQIFADVPHHVVPRERLDGQGYPLVDALVEAGLVKSKGEARRVIGEGGAYLNNRRCDDSSRMLGRNDLASTSIIVLRRGKKNYALVTLDSV